MNDLNNRLGFHYFPDTLHYREQDLSAWLPELRELGAGWLTLQAPADRAIPETFIRGLVEGGIKPVLHFKASYAAPPNGEELGVLLKVYASWGVRYAAFYDRPNCIRSWGSTLWARPNLIARFLDLFNPLAEAALAAGIRPLFSPLEPGGDYWDTAFLRAALQQMEQRGETELLHELALGAYGWVHPQGLDWGAGGPERWPGTRPYYTPEGEEDQRGFYITDWYNAISEAVTGKTLPVLLLAAGHNALPEDENAHTADAETMARLLRGLPSDADGMPNNLISANLWLLAAAGEDPEADVAWYRADGRTLPAVGALKVLRGESPIAKSMPPFTNNGHNPGGARHIPQGKSLPFDAPQAVLAADGKNISHYLLLPTYEWGVADWHLEVIQPFIKKHLPTVGFNLQEACLAEYVTVVGGEQSFSQEAIAQLQAAGCIVTQISGDGTTIATRLQNI